MSKLTKRQVLHQFKLWCNDPDYPPTAETLVDSCRFPISICDWGAFRAAYRVVDTDFIIKLPLYDRSWGKIRHKANRRHAFQEWEAYSDVITSKKGSKFYELKEFMPEIYECCANTGAILMKRYEVLDDSKWAGDIREELGKYVNAVLWKADRDIDNSGNIGQDLDTGRIVILDLGYLHGW